MARQLLDNVMVQSGIPFNVQEGTDRQYKLINNYLEVMVNTSTRIGDGGATRKTEEPTLK